MRVLRAASSMICGSVVGAIEIVGEGIGKATEAPETFSDFLSGLWDRGGWNRPLAVIISPLWLPLNAIAWAVALLMVVAGVLCIGVVSSVPLLLFAAVTAALYSLFSDTSFLDAVGQALGALSDNGSTGP